MDKVLRRKGLWVGLAVIGLIFLCVIMCVLGPLLMLIPRQTVTYAPAPYVQPPALEEGAAPQGYSGPIIGRHTGLGPLGIVGYGFRLLLKLIFFGLLLLLGLRLMRHLLWGPRHWCTPYWGPHYHGKPPRAPAGWAPEGGEGEAGWGPPPWTRRAWHHHRHHWGPPPWWGSGQEQAGEGRGSDARAANAPGANVPGAGVPDDEYTGPQE